MENYISFLQETVAGQRWAQRFHIALAVGGVLLGLVTIMLAHLPVVAAAVSDSKWLLTMGGTFFSSLASFPLKEFFRRRERIAALEFLLGEFKALRCGSETDEPRAQRAKERFWKLVDTNLAV